MKSLKMNSFKNVFSNLPIEITTRLESSYNEIKANFRHGRYEPSELNGGKFSEVVFRVLEWRASGGTAYTQFGHKINNLSASLKQFETQPNLSDSIRFHIPKILTALYNIRNKRGVGHIGGDVDPNYMDALFVIAACDWVMAELVRLFHNISPEDAQKLVTELVTKSIPIVWDTGEDGVKRVLASNLSFKDKSLALLYHQSPEPIKDNDLFKWVEHSNETIFKNRILKACHQQRLLEYNESNGMVRISPIGVDYVEKNVPLEV